MFYQIDFLTKRRIGRSFGFTLVELLVVIAIIGILITISLAILSNSRARARDSRRVSDIDNLTKALAFYANNHSAYPVSADWQDVDGGAGDTLTDALKADSIIRAIIEDPQKGAGGFVYQYRSDGATYTLQYCLETNSIAGQSSGCGHQISN